LFLLQFYGFIEQMTGPNFPSPSPEEFSDLSPEIAGYVDDFVNRLAVESLTGNPDVLRRGVYHLPDLGEPFYHPYLFVEVWPVWGDTPEDYAEYRTVAFYDEVDEDGNYSHDPALKVISDQNLTRVEAYGQDLDDTPTVALASASRALNWLESMNDLGLLRPLPKTAEAQNKFDHAREYVQTLARERLVSWGTDGFLMFNGYDRDHKIVTVTRDGDEVNLMSKWIAFPEYAGNASKLFRRHQAVRFDGDALYFKDNFEEGIVVDGTVVATNEGDIGDWEDAGVQQKFLVQLARLLELMTQHDVIPARRPHH
jgi:hypothetical protein